jgi:HAAS domain-containing protein
VKVMVDDPIEEYLDRLLVVLSGSPREIRRTLTEAESHLYESAAALEASGLSSEEAREEAVRRMGPVEVAAGPARVTLYLTPPLRRRVALSLLLIGGVGCVAIGIAGVLALIVREVWGPAAIANAFPADSYTAADCRGWEAAHPTAHDCLSVMTALHASHFLKDTLACGLLGIAALVLYVRLQRRWSLPGRIGELFDIELLVGAAAAATVAAIFLFRGLDTWLITHDNGLGQPFCLAAGAAAAAVYFVLRARRRGVTAHLGSRRPPPRALA